MFLETDIDVIILGAGMAGLVAARALAERGLRVCILEARQRVGGRVVSQKVEGGGTVELGAEFVHGRAPELWALIDEVGARTVERDGQCCANSGVVVCSKTTRRMRRCLSH